MTRRPRLQALYAILICLGLAGIAGGIGYMLGWRDAVQASLSNHTMVNELLSVPTTQGPVVSFRRTANGWVPAKVFHHERLNEIQQGWPGGVFIEITMSDGTTIGQYCTGNLEAYECQGSLGPTQLQRVDHLTLMPGSKNPVYLDLELQQ
jgi:hypothetical protein